MVSHVFAERPDCRLVTRPPLVAPGQSLLEDFSIDLERLSLQIQLCIAQWPSLPDSISWEIASIETLCDLENAQQTSDRGGSLPLRLLPMEDQGMECSAVWGSWLPSPLGDRFLCTWDWFGYGALEAEWLGATWYWSSNVFLTRLTPARVWRALQQEAPRGQGLRHYFRLSTRITWKCTRWWQGQVFSWLILFTLLSAD